MPLEDLLEDECFIEDITPYGQVVGQDVLGAPDRISTRAEVVAGLACLVRITASSYQIQDDERRNVITARLYFGEDLLDQVAGGLNTRHRITVTKARDASVLGVYQVTGTIPVNSMRRLYHVDCERVRVP